MKKQWKQDPSNLFFVQLPLNYEGTDPEKLLESNSYKIWQVHNKCLLWGRSHVSARCRDEVPVLNISCSTKRNKSRSKHNTMSIIENIYSHGVMGYFVLLRWHFLWINYSSKIEVEEIKGSQFWDMDIPGKSLMQDQGEICRLSWSWIHAQDLGADFLGGRWCPSLTWP